MESIVSSLFSQDKDADYVLTTFARVVEDAKSFVNTIDSSESVSVSGFLLHLLFSKLFLSPCMRTYTLLVVPWLLYTDSWLRTTDANGGIFFWVCVFKDFFLINHNYIPIIVHNELLASRVYLANLHCHILPYLPYKLLPLFQLWCRPFLPIPTSIKLPSFRYYPTI